MLLVCAKAAPGSRHDASTQTSCADICGIFLACVDILIIFGQDFFAPTLFADLCVMIFVCAEIVLKALGIRLEGKRRHILYQAPVRIIFCFGAVCLAQGQQTRLFFGVFFLIPMQIMRCIFFSVPLTE